MGPPHGVQALTWLDLTWLELTWLDLTWRPSHLARRPGPWPEKSRIYNIHIVQVIAVYSSVTCCKTRTTRNDAIRSKYFNFWADRVSTRLHWKLLPQAEIASTCGGSASWHWLEPAMAYNSSCMAQTDWSTIGWFQNVVNEIFIRILEICKLHCFTWWQSLGKTHLALEPRGWEAWTSIFSTANSSTKFLPLASLRQSDWHCRKHRSLVSIQHPLHFLLSAIMFLKKNVIFHVFVFNLYMQCFCVSPPVP